MTVTADHAHGSAHRHAPAVTSPTCPALLVMHASGIRVDEAAKSGFAAASNDASCGYLKFKIANDTFVLQGKGKAANTVEGNWQEIQKGLSESAHDPCFIVARGVSKEAAKWLLIFFMPEGCTVRDRMVYAASAAALKDGLGQGNFEAATYSMSHPREACAADYAAVSRSMSQDELLTLDEKAALDGEMQSALAMSSTRQRAIVGLPIKASDEALEALANVQRGEPNTVILSLNADTEVLQVQQAGNFTFEQIQSKLPASEPRYILQNFAHEHDGKQQNAFVFGYYCTDDAKPKLKMFYSTCKQVVVKLCENLSINLSRSVEFSDPKELSTPLVLEELYPTAAAKKVFKKPARPGRGNARLIASPNGGAASSPSAASASASPSP